MRLLGNAVRVRKEPRSRPESVLETAVRAKVAREGRMICREGASAQDGT